MKRFVVLVLIVFLVPFVAAEAEYWAVAAEDGTTMDVVNGANFAASMKGSVAVSFTGKTFEQAQEALLTQEIEDTVIVIFDGDEAMIMADENEFPRVVEASEKYLLGQGFSIDTEEPDVSYFIEEAVEEPEEAPESCPMDAKVCPDGTEVGRDPDNCEVFLPCPEPEEDPEPSPAQEDDVAEEVPEAEPRPEKKPNVFVRVLSWFASIFS